MARDDSEERSEDNEVPVDGGARFWSVDLHVHTPGSSDVIASQYGDVLPAEVVATAIASGLDAIAITDHNTSAWCDDVARAAEDGPLVVLPGVEISTTEGHLLAIFEEGTSGREIEDLLAAIGIPSTRQGQLDVTSAGGFIETARKVEEFGGIAIAAHIDREKGLLKLEVGARRREALCCEAISAFEVVNRESESVAQRKVDRTRRLPFVRGSDSMVSGEDGHRLVGVGQRRTWIKAGMPDLLGLRHALNDPKLRVRISEPAVSTHRYIKSLEVSGGFLDGARILFSPDMTCLLGGTGTGKSLALELIRFALDQQTDPAELAPIRDEVDLRLENALGSDSSVSLVVHSPRGDTTIRRAFAGSESPPPEVVDSPESDVRSFMPIRAFSQGEVIEYARTPVGRMLLIDGNLDLSEEEAREEEAAEALHRNGETLLEIWEKIADVEESIEEMGDSAARLKELSDLFDADIVKEQDRWSDERVSIRSLRSAVPRKNALKIRMDVSFEDKASIASNEDLFSKATSAIERLNAKIDTANTKVEKARAKAKKTLVGVDIEWSRRSTLAEVELNEAVADAVKDAELVGLDLGALRSTLADLQVRESQRKRDQKKLTRLQSSTLKKAIKHREALIDTAVSVRREKRRKRAERIKTLNSLMAEVVKVKLVAEGDSEAFESELLDIARGCGLQKRTLQKIADNAHPLKLVRSFICSDPEAAAQATKTKTSQIRKLFDHVVTSGRTAEMLALQHSELRDTLTIGFKQRQTDTEYVRIERLAHGQKCTAILVLALADGSEPLIIDQPEDALHAPWIEDHLVERLRSLRGTRQFLFASRSPGLVVSADAELVVTLDATADRGIVQASGSLERLDLNRLALYHLEGGPTAFNRRSLKFEQSLDVHE